MIKLLLTADYEIFGNGSGDIYKCLIEPTTELIKVCNKYNTRLTLFVDVCEIWSFIDIGKKHLYYQKASKCILNQLKIAISQGHDVQLHLHPQWIESKWLEDDKKWNLNLDNWRIGFLKSPNINGASITPHNLIKKGKSWLSELFKDVSNYKCKAFRAGGWSIQPNDEQVIKALEKEDFKYDTSVAPGLYFDDGLTYYNFLDAENKFEWIIKDNVTKYSKDGKITEIPIATASFNIIQNAYNKYKYKKFPLPDGCIGFAESKKTSSWANKIYNNISKSGRTKMLDFCDRNIFELKYITNSYIGRQRDNTKIYPMVAIGHPKGYTNRSHFQKFLDWCAHNNNLLLEDLNEESFWK